MRPVLEMMFSRRGAQALANRGGRFMFELRSAVTGEVLATESNYADIMDTAGFYLSYAGGVEVWCNGELVEDL